MDILDSLSQSSQWFAICWDDPHCRFIREATQNVDSFIAIYQTEQAGFDALFHDDADREDRKQRLAASPNMPVRLDSYVLKGTKTPLLFVSEEIMHDDAGGYLSVFVDITRQIDRILALQHRVPWSEPAPGVAEPGVWHSDPQPTRFAPIRSDMAALSQVGAEARRTLASRTQFFSHVVHEIRTPCTVSWRRLICWRKGH